MNGPYGGSIRSLETTATGTVFAGAYFGGVYRSHDGGITWLESGMDGRIITSLLVDSNGGLWAGTGAEGVYHSTDEGRTWAPVDFQRDCCHGDFAIYDIEEHQSGSLIAATISGVYRSQDRGRTWTSVFSGSRAFDVIQIAENGAIYLAGNYGLYQSTDVGDSWTAIDIDIAAPLHPVIHSLVLDQSGSFLLGLAGGIIRSQDEGDTWSTLFVVEDQVRALFVDSLGIIVAGTQRGIYATRDGGDTWTKPSFPNVEVHKFMELGDGTLLAGTHAGVFRSTDGDLWTSSNTGLAATWINHLAAAGRDTVFAADAHAIFRTTDGGESWENVLDQYTRSLAASPDGSVFAASSGGLKRSTDHGETWLDAGLTSTRSISVGRDGRVFALQHNDLLRSDDRGQTWTSIYRNIASVLPTSDQVNLTNVFVGSGANIFVATGWEESRLYRSADAGESWSDTGLRLESVSDMAVDEQGRIWLTTLAGTVHASTDGGETWIDMTRDLPDVTIDAVSGVPGNDVLVGSRRDGIFRSSSSDQTWTGANDGLQNLWISDIAVDRGGRVYAATAGGGVFRSDSFTSTRIQTEYRPRSDHLFEVYPNPMHRSASVRYSLQRNGHVQLRILNPIGQQISILVQQRQAPGTYTIEWRPPNDIANGVYLFVLEVDGELRTKSVIRL